MRQRAESVNGEDLDSVAVGGVKRASALGLMKSGYSGVGKPITKETVQMPQDFLCSSADPGVWQRQARTSRWHTSRKTVGSDTGHKEALSPVSPRPSLRSGR